MSTPRLRSRPSADPRPGLGDSGLLALRGGGRRPPLLLVPEGRSDPRPLVVFFHGAGGSGDHGVPMMRHVAVHRGLLVLLPTSRGPTWDAVRGGLGVDVEALDASLSQVFEELPVSRVAFAGFSDGGSYALTLGLAHGDLADAVLAYSPGFVAAPEQVGSPRVWISHGTADTVLPVDRCGRRLATVLSGAGYDVRYEEFDGGHVVPAHLVSGSVDWWLGPAAVPGA